MNNVYKICSALLLALGLLACGKEEPATLSYSVQGQIAIADPESRNNTQQLMFGAFKPNSRQPLYWVELSETTADGLASFKLNQVPEGEYQFKIYVAERTINKVVLHTFGPSSLSGELDLGSTPLQLLTFARLQSQVFNSCAQCHGMVQVLAANLSFMEGQTYANLVNHNSKNSDKPRVAPGDANGSFLMQVLHKENLPFEHSGSSTATDADKQLVQQWINAGAPNN